MKNVIEDLTEVVAQHFEKHDCSPCHWDNTESDKLNYLDQCVESVQEKYDDIPSDIIEKYASEDWENYWALEDREAK